MAAALQAVDGVALKAAVDAWATAPAADKPTAFSAAFAVRQIEIGLASLLSILFGATAALYGLLLYGDGRYPTWIGGVAVASGIGVAAGGIAIAYGGFSATVMNIQMPASLLLLTWITAVAAILWRRSGQLGGVAARFQSLLKPPKNRAADPASAQPGLPRTPPLPPPSPRPTNTRRCSRSARIPPNTAS